MSDVIRYERQGAQGGPQRRADRGAGAAHAEGPARPGGADRVRIEHARQGVQHRLAAHHEQAGGEDRQHEHARRAPHRPDRRHGDGGEQEHGWHRFGVVEPVEHAGEQETPECAADMEQRGHGRRLGRVSPMPKPGTPGVTADLVKRVVAEPAIRVYTALGATPVPVLAVVRGRAEGYGLGLLAAADVVLAGDAAAFSIPEMQRQIPPTLVMTSLLGRAPAKLVAHLVLSQETIGAADPRALGLVSKVVADDALDEEMRALTERILAYRTDSVRAIKEYLRFADGRDRSAAGSFAANLAASALSARFGGET